MSLSVPRDSYRIIKVEEDTPKYVPGLRIPSEIHRKPGTVLNIFELSIQNQPAPELSKPKVNQTLPNLTSLSESRHVQDSPENNTPQPQKKRILPSFVSLFGPDSGFLEKIVRKDAIKIEPKQSGYSCPYEGCTKTFTRKFNLKSHLYNHKGIKPFECPDCSRSFTRRHDMKRHVRMIHR